MVSKSQPQPETLTGTAEDELVRRGTGSQHTAVVLATPQGERLILQRIGGNPFSDKETRALVGHQVIVEGFRLNDIFRYVRATVKDTSR